MHLKGAKRSNVESLCNIATYINIINRKGKIEAYN